jgi:uncharacterized damage-inducible protein DinB
MADQIEQIAIIPGEGTTGFLELAARPGMKPSGKLFKKQILKWGSFIHPSAPGKRIKVDRTFADQLVTNFASGACDIVQFPVVNDANKHVEGPDHNLGEVIDLDYDENGVNAYIDVRKNADDIGRTILGASALMHLDYTNTLTGQRMGPTLLHVAATNRPYLTNLAPFSEVIAASADTPDEAAIWTAEKEPQPVLNEDDTQEIEPVQEQQEVQLSEPGGDDMPNTKEDLIAALMEHGIGDEEDGLSVRDVAEAVLELSQKNTEQAELIASLAAANEAMEQERAINEVDELIRVGRILPRQRDVMIKLARNDRETFEQLIPDEAIVSLSEDGVTTHESSNTDEVNDEIKRLTDLATAWTKNHK